jgi:CheY-like chemotaxis protein
MPVVKQARPGADGEAMARVLVVEDEPTMRELVTARLRVAGHQIVAAEDGATAVDVVTRRGAPDVVVLDIGLPDTDGYSLLASLRTAAGEKPFGAVFLSGEIDPASIARGEALGAIYLTKPFIASALLKAIDQAVAPPQTDDGW